MKPKLQNKNGETMVGINKGTNGVNCRLCESEKDVKMREISGEESSKETVTIHLCNACVAKLSVLPGLVKDE